MYKKRELLVLSFKETPNYSIVTAFHVQSFLWFCLVVLKKSSRLLLGIFHSAFAKTCFWDNLQISDFCLKIPNNNLNHTLLKFAGGFLGYMYFLMDTFFAGSLSLPIFCKKLSVRKNSEALSLRTRYLYSLFLNKRIAICQSVPNFCRIPYYFVVNVMKTDFSGVFFISLVLLLQFW